MNDSHLLLAFLDKGICASKLGLVLLENGLDLGNLQYKDSGFRAWILVLREAP
jgi:hypothetical protein